MNAFVITTIVIGGAVIGLIGAEIFLRIYYAVIRSTDKSRMKAAIAREAYLNRLYEESMYEQMDKMANQYAKQMEQVRRRYH